MKNEKWARKKATTTSTAAAGCSASCLDGFTLQQAKSKRAGAKSVRHTLDIIRSGFQCILFYYRNAFTKYILILSMFSFFFSAVVVAPSFVCVCVFFWFMCLVWLFFFSKSSSEVYFFVVCRLSSGTDKISAHIQNDSRKRNANRIRFARFYHSHLNVLVFLSLSFGSDDTSKRILLIRCSPLAISKK